MDDLDLGPDELKLGMTDKDLQSAQQKEINRLREDLGQLTTELETLKIRVSPYLLPEVSLPPNAASLIFLCIRNEWVIIKKMKGEPLGES